MWFTNFNGDTIGRITTSGQVTTYTAPGISSPAVITHCLGGTLWFTNNTGASIGRNHLRQLTAPPRRGADRDPRSGCVRRGVAREHAL